MNLRKPAALLVAVGLTLGLLGAGISASYSDGATAVQNINVGTFGIEISSSVVGVLVSPDKHSVTYAATDIVSSAAGNRAFPFTVKSTGSVPTTVRITQTTPVDPFFSILLPPADVNMVQNQTVDYTGGIGWTELVNNDLSKAATITYTASAIETPAVPPPPPPPPAIGYVGTASAAGTTVSLPVGWEVGDMALVFATKTNGALPPAVPTGWYDPSGGYTASAGMTASRVGSRVLQAGDTNAGNWVGFTHVSVAVYRNVGFVGNATRIGAIQGYTTSKYVTFPGLDLFNATGTSWVVGFAYQTGIASVFAQDLTAPAGIVNRSVGQAASAVKNMVVVDTNGGVASFAETKVWTFQPSGQRDFNGISVELTAR